ncbi:MAG TPA: hypothetical protein VJ110_00790 [Candidatus Nanoarchaeia archaeon]|nr:hypothetical protein [Candidatus Nanoarchaeia archaeon]
MRTPKQRFSVAAVTLALVPIAVVNAINTSSVLLVGLAAIAAMLSGLVFALAADEVIRQRY